MNLRSMLRNGNDNAKIQNEAGGLMGDDLNLAGKVLSDDDLGRVSGGVYQPDKGDKSLLEAGEFVLCPENLK